MYQCIFLIFLLASNGLSFFFYYGERELERERSIIFFLSYSFQKRRWDDIIFVHFFVMSPSFFFSSGRFCFFRGGHGAREQVI